jgi:hypothetical protein
MPTLITTTRDFMRPFTKKFTAHGTTLTSEAALNKVIPKGLLNASGNAPATALLNVYSY